MERQYIGARYVPVFANPIEWDTERAFEALTVVTYMGASYTSKKAVPAGVKPTDTKYWACTGNYNAQVESYRQDVMEFMTLLEGMDETMADVFELTPLAEHSKMVTVGAKGCNFKTINEAIEVVKGYATNSNRVTIVITAGAYNEEIKLLPNPGIDFVGIGKVKVQSASVYPNAPLYMSGKANIENIEFLCLESNSPSYAVHIEAQSDPTATELKFKNCVFQSNSGYAGMGVGLGEGYNVECRGCRFVSTANAALYLHNNPEAHQNKAIFRCYNCDFYGLSGTDVVVHNARDLQGNTGIAPVTLSFAGCVGNTNKMIYKTSTGSTHYIPADSEFNLEATSVNTLLGLDYKRRTVTLRGDYPCYNDSIYIPYTEGGQYDWAVSSAFILSTGRAITPSITGTDGSIRLDGIGANDTGVDVRVFLTGTAK